MPTATAQSSFFVHFRVFIKLGSLRICIYMSKEPSGHQFLWGHEVSAAGARIRDKLSSRFGLSSALHKVTELCTVPFSVAHDFLPYHRDRQSSNIKPRGRIVYLQGDDLKGRHTAHKSWARSAFAVDYISLVTNCYMPLPPETSGEGRSIRGTTCMPGCGHLRRRDAHCPRPRPSNTAISGQILRWFTDNHVRSQLCAPQAYIKTVSLS